MPPKNPTTKRTLLTLTTLLLNTLAASPPTDAPRTDINPTTAEVLSPPPAIVDPLTDAEYAKLYAEAIKTIGPAPKSDKLPLSGARITTIDPNSPGSITSLHVGDIIVAIDGKPTLTANAAKAAHRAATAEQTLDVISFDQPTHQFINVDPGPLGINVEDAWLLENQYLHDLPPTETPVDEIRIAARYADNNPALAESVLAHAQKTSAPGITAPIVNAIAAIALYNDSWFESALSYATAASKTLPPDTSSSMNKIIVDSAIATFRFPLADAIAKQDFRYTAALATTAPEMALFQSQQHTSADPNPLSANISFTDQTKNVVNLARHVNREFEMSEYLVWYLKNRRTIPFTSPDGSYTICHCGPGGTNVAFSADCHFAATDNGKSGYVKVVRIGVVSNDGTRKTLELYLDGTADALTTIGASTATLNLKRLTTNRTFNIKMTIVNDRYEYYIDNRRISYGPFPSPAPDKPRNLTLSLQTVGVTGEFTHVTWKTAGPN